MREKKNVYLWALLNLKDARELREEARKLLTQDIDPSEYRKAKKASRMQEVTNSFEVVDREWFAKYSKQWTEGHGSRIIRRLERDVFP